MSGLVERQTPVPLGGDARELWLAPFSAPPRHRSVRVRVRRAEGGLTIRWVVEGELDDLLLPVADPLPRRLDGLWQESCLEAFLSVPGTPGYLELNLAPAGHWAAYRFDAPRAGMRLEPRLDRLDIRTHRVPGHFAIRCILPADTLGLADGPLRAGLSAILLRRDGQREFWALAHLGAQPDFHDPASHLLDMRGA